MISQGYRWHRTVGRICGMFALVVTWVGGLWLLPGTAAHARAPDGIGAADWAAVQTRINRDQLKALDTGGDVELYSRAQKIRATLNKTGIGFSRRSVPLFRLRTTHLNSYALSPNSARANGTRGEFVYPLLTEWLENNEVGFEHGWTIQRAPSDGGQLILSVSLTGGFVRNHEASLVLTSARTGDALVYGAPVAWDAENRSLPARLVVDGPESFRVVVDAEDVAYPVTIDPLIQVAGLDPEPEKPSSRHRAFGTGAAISEDGRTLVVGDPANRNRGAAYVFVQDGSGEWIHEATLRASDAQENDFFGYAIALSGETVLIGAHLEDAGRPPSVVTFEGGSAYVFTRTDGVWTQQQKLISSDGAEDDNFGFSVAIKGGTALIGAPGDDDKGAASGSVYSFTRSGGVWSEQSKLVATDGAEFDGFGKAVALSGATALVGAHLADSAADDAGAAYVFRASGAAWVQEAKLVASDAEEDDYFGFSVDISETTALVGAYSYDDAFESHSYNVGAAYVFELSNGRWNQQARLNAPYLSVHEWFGYSVALANDSLIVGAPWATTTGQGPGSAYIFQRLGQEWSFREQILPSDRKDNDRVGATVALVDGTALVVAPEHDWGGDYVGAVYVYERFDSSWVERSELISPDSVTEYDDNFGQAVALSGDTVLVGAPGDDVVGAAYVFVVDHDTWVRQAKLSVPGSSEFGTSVALDGDTALIGAPSDTGDIGRASAGAAYVFSRTGEQWALEAKIVPSDATSRGFFGESVALSEDVALIGGTGGGDDNGQDRRGSAYIFTRSDGTWAQEAKLLAADTVGGDYFGRSVALSGGTALIGADGDDDVGTGSGSAYLFIRSGDDWTETAKLTASDGAAGHAFGRAVALSGDTALVGAELHRSAYVFVQSKSGWAQQARLTASDPESGSYFGQSVALYEGIALIGAPFHDGHAVDSGVVFQFVRSGERWAEQAQLFSVEAAFRDGFGSAVATDGLRRVVGAFEADTELGPDAGRAYVFESEPSDFGDAPDPGYPTLLASDGARHRLSPLFLGSSVDADDDGQPNATATGDDIDAAANDEDGVLFGDLTIGSTEATLELVVSQQHVGLVNAFVDFNQDGDFYDDAEQIVADELIEAVSEKISFVVPDTARSGVTYARVRISSAGGDGPAGAAVDGEVEDHEVTLSLPTLSVADAVLIEGDAGPTELGFTVSIPVPVQQDVSFSFESVDGTATASDDFNSVSSNASIPGGQGLTSVDVSVPVLGDTTYETDETFVLMLSNASGATITDSEATGLIQNDDNQPSVTLAASGDSLAESGGVLAVTATLSNPSSEPVAVDLGLSGTADVSDFTISTNQIVIVPGETIGVATLSGTDDLIHEGEEVIIVDIASVSHGTEADVQQLTVTLADDDPLPDVTLSQSGARLSEANEQMTMTVTLSNPSVQPVTVELDLDGSADTDDYQASTSQLVIDPGDVTAAMTITALQDEVDEDDETIVVSIASVANGTVVAPQQLTVVIVDDDTAPIITLRTSDDSLTEQGGVVIVSAVLSMPSAQIVTIDLTIGGGADLDEDYAVGSPSITIPAGELGGEVEITGLDDETDEPMEAIVIVASGVHGGQLSGVGSFVLSIVDDDPTPAGLAPRDESSAVINRVVAPGQQRVTLASFGIRNSLTGSAYISTLTGPVSGELAVPATVELFLDLNGNRRLDPNDTLLADTAASIGAATLSFNLGAPLNIPAQSTLRFVMVADLEVR